MVLSVFVLVTATVLPIAGLLLSSWASERRRIARARRGDAATTAPTNSRWAGVDPDRRLPTGFHRGPKVRDLP